MFVPSNAKVSQKLSKKTLQINATDQEPPEEKTPEMGFPRQTTMIQRGGDRWHH
jgi:hypothetical protein